MEIDRVEDTIAEEKLRDISDIVISLARNMQEMQDAQIAEKLRGFTNGYDEYSR